MKESITKKLLSNAIRQFATQLSVQPKQTQLIITTDDDSYATPRYALLNNYKKVRQIQFNDIYNGDTSIFSFAERTALSLLPSDKEKVLEQNIAKLIINIAQKNSASASKVQVMIWTSDDKAENLLFHLYVVDEKGKKQDKGKIELSQLLN